MESIEKAIMEIVSEHLFGKIDQPINLTDKLEDDLGADSLDRIEITMHIEDDFGIEIPDEDMDRMITIQDIIDYVEKKIKG